MIEDFEVMESGIDEEQSLLAHQMGADRPFVAAEVLARLKAEAIAPFRPRSLVIGADTIVVLNGRELNKPKDVSDACSMLSLLSGREHEVITGVHLLADGINESFFDLTRVRFRGLSDREIAEYVDSGEPMDKAGGYAIQGGAKQFISKVDGSWSNVVGLPIEMLGNRLMMRGLVRSVR